MNKITTNNTIPIPIPIDTNEFDGHQFFLAKTISLACEVPIESVDTMNHLSPLSFLISTCLLVVAMNAVLILLAPVKAGLEYLHHSGDKKKRNRSLIVPGVILSGLCYANPIIMTLYSADDPQATIFNSSELFRQKQPECDKVCKAEALELI